MYNYLKLLIKRPKKIFFNEYSLEFDVDGIAKTNIDKFRELYNLTDTQDLPMSFAFIAGFKPMMKAFAHKHFAYAPLGLIHLSAEFKQSAHINYQSPFTVKIKVKQNRRHPLGKLVQVESQFIQNGQLCVTSKNSMLKKLQSIPSKKVANPQLFNEPTTISVNRDLARSYASVSYDYNPIHISNKLAKLFGLPQAIMHGMYFAHLILANNDIEQHRVKFEFKKPCLLPSSVGLANNDNQYQVFSGSEDLHLNCKVFD